MDYKELIYSRHSVRKFQDKEVPQDIINEIIEEAKTAPSSKNSKSAAFMVVTDSDTILAISEMRDSGTAFSKNAKAMIVVLGDETKSPEMWVEDASIAATFIQLSAVAHGLGSCWLQVRLRKCVKADTAPDAPTAEAYVKELLGIREEMRVECVVALGYEAE